MNWITKIRRLIARNGVLLTLRIGWHELDQCWRDIFWRRVFGLKQVRIGSGARVRGLSSITVGNNLTAGRFLWLEAIQEYKNKHYTPKIVIGSNVSISDFTTIVASNLVEIEEGVLIASKVLI